MTAELIVENKKENLTPEFVLCESVPFILGTPLRIRSTADPALKTQALLVGVIPRLAILVENPVFSSEGERVTGRVGGDILCVYVHEGRLYRFKSRFGQSLIHNVVCIDYPRKIEMQNLRRYPRVKVELDTVGSIGKEGRLMNGSITDISQSGCCLELPGLILVEREMPVCATFELPNDDHIEDVSCTIVNIRKISSEKKTIVGMSFNGPESEIGKIKRFCEMCMYLKV
jgi:c-di-GMP-binding flagellar brake protein YcgR